MCPVIFSVFCDRCPVFCDRCPVFCVVSYDTYSEFYLLYTVSCDVTCSVSCVIYSASYILCSVFCVLCSVVCILSLVMFVEGMGAQVWGEQSYFLKGSAASKLPWKSYISFFHSVLCV